MATRCHWDGKKEKCTHHSSKLGATGIIAPGEPAVFRRAIVDEVDDRSACDAAQPLREDAKRSIHLLWASHGRVNIKVVVVVVMLVTMSS